jgi:hypothetical protein
MCCHCSIVNVLRIFGSHDKLTELRVLDKFVFGFSSSLRHSIGPYATFVPAPNQTYQIKPSKVFFVTIGQYNARDLVKDGLRTSTASIRVDFGDLGTNDVQLVHDEQGKLQRYLAGGDDDGDTGEI